MRLPDSGDRVAMRREVAGSFPYIGMRDQVRGVLGSTRVLSLLSKEVSGRGRPGSKRRRRAAGVGGVIL